MANLKKIAIIPARSGSKGIPNKNLCKLQGKSLVKRISLTAINSSIFDEIVLSSDSNSILNEVIDLKVTRHLRSSSASNDKSTASEVIWDWLNNNNCSAGSADDTVVCYLQPTSPFTSVKTIRNIIDLHIYTNKAVVSIAKHNFIPQKFLIKNQEGLLQSFLPESSPTSNRQNFNQTFYPTGGVYCFRLADFYSLRDIPVIGALGHVVEFPEFVDVDTPADLIFAQHLADEKSIS